MWVGLTGAKSSSIVQQLELEMNWPSFLLRSYVLQGLRATGSTLKTCSLSSRLYSIKAHSSLTPTVVYAHSLPPTVQSVSLFSTSSQPPTTQSTDTEDDEETRSRELKRLRIALIVGPAWFVLLMYLCFFREEKEGGIIDYLNQDIRHNKRLPPDVQQKAKELYGNSDK